MAALFVWTLRDVIGLTLAGVLVAVFAVMFAAAYVMDLWKRFKRRKKGGGNG